MKLSYLDVQERLLNKVKDKTSGKLVDVISEALNVSSDSAYRRIRNEKVMTLDEVLALCTKFHISFDETIGDANNKTVAFSFNYKDSNYDFQNYLETILDHLNRIRKGKGKFYYSAKDIPIFHFFQSKELTAFKMFYWLKTMSNADAQFTSGKFSFDLIPAKLLELTKQIYTTYSQIDSYEIWNYETIHSTTNQILYYKDLGYISENQALLLLDKLDDLLNHLQEEVEHEYKFHMGNKAIGEESNYKFYYNEIIAADNSIYAEYGDVKESFKPHIVLNYMTTNNEEYCSYIKSLFEGVIKKSTVISGVNEKDRNVFFNYNRKRVNIARRKMEVFDDE